MASFLWYNTGTHYIIMMPVPYGSINIPFFCCFYGCIIWFVVEFFLNTGNLSPFVGQKNVE